MIASMFWDRIPPRDGRRDPGGDDDGFRGRPLGRVLTNAVPDP